MQWFSSSRLTELFFYQRLTKRILVIARQVVNPLLPLFLTLLTVVEMRGFEPLTSYVQGRRSPTELHPLLFLNLSHPLAISSALSLVQLPKVGSESMTPTTQQL
jgi:hypothetical protein